MKNVYELAGRYRFSLVIGIITNLSFLIITVIKPQPFYGRLIQDNLDEPVLSQRRDLLEQPLDSYEPDVISATQPIVSKHYRKPSGLVVFCFIDMVSAPHVQRTVSKHCFNSY